MNATNPSFIAHHNKKIAYSIIGFTSLSLIVNIVDLLTGGYFSYNFIVIIICFIASFLYFKSPYFSYSNGELCLYNLIGIKVRKYQLDSNQLLLENNKIYLQGNEKRIKIPISKFMTEEDDWQRLIALTQKV